MTQLVIDVSEHNGQVDWQKVKNAGYHAIIRLGYGQEIANQRDKQAVRNVSECERLSISYGLYLYSYATSTERAAGEAQHAINFIRQCCKDNFKYPCFYDVEEKNLGSVARKNATIFCKLLTDQNVKAGVYANESWWNSYLKDFSNDYPRWVAKWSEKRPEVSNISLWQYTDKGRVPGVNSACDISYSYYEIGKNNTNGSSNKTVDQLADEVLAGKYGNGNERKKALGENYDIVQAIVNYRTGIKSVVNTVATDVLKGRYGNGQTRRDNLGSLYEPVQKEVNKRLKK